MHVYLNGTLIKTLGRQTQRVTNVRQFHRESRRSQVALTIQGRSETPSSRLNVTRRLVNSTAHRPEVCCSGPVSGAYDAIRDPGRRSDELLPGKATIGSPDRFAGPQYACAGVSERTGLHAPTTRIFVSRNRFGVDVTSSVTFDRSLTRTTSSATDTTGPLRVNAKTALRRPAVTDDLEVESADSDGIDTDENL